MATYNNIEPYIFGEIDSYSGTGPSDTLITVPGVDSIVAIKNLRIRGNTITSEGNFGIYLNDNLIEEVTGFEPLGEKNYGGFVNPGNKNIIEISFEGETSVDNYEIEDLCVDIIGYQYI